MRTILGIACALLILAAPALADDVSGRYGIGIEGAAMKLVGGDHDYSDLNPNYALNLRYGLSPHLSLEGALKALWVHPGVENPGDEAGLEWHNSHGIYSVFWQTRLGLLYHLTPERAISPYFGFGLGLSGSRVKDLTDGSEFGGLFPGGPIVEGYDEDGNKQHLSAVHFSGTLSAGLEWFFAPNFAFDLGARYHLFPANDMDNIGLSADTLQVGPGWGPEHVDANTGMAELYAGFTWFFGSVDADGDGILDADDACPDTPEDFDGFQDGDGCPDPDNDGDGIPDSADRCPGSPEDLDGFQDDDGCPDPDNDGDGVADAADACPGTPAGVTVDEKGCPKAKEIKKSLVLDGVNFLSGSNELTPESLVILDTVAQSLLAYPEVIVEIQGHTDSAGGAAFNETLSLGRAEAVRDYLVSHGVPIRRMRAVGYGERFPIASNSTAQGRAENRRVEIHRIRD